MNISFIVDHHVPAGGIIFQDEAPVEVEVLYAMPEEFTWEPSVYLDGFRLSECEDMDEAIARATGWKLRYNRLDETRKPSFGRLGGMAVFSGHYDVQVSLWKVEITGLEGKIVKLQRDLNEERIYAV